jgi:TusA-related sulfurtransferase
MMGYNRLAIIALAAVLVCGVVARSHGEEQRKGASAGAEEQMMMGGKGMGQSGMCGQMMGGGSMMGGGPMMMGGCPMMAPGVTLKVDKIKNGATITLTSDDPKVVRRIQTRAEIMRLMHQLQSEEEPKQSE